MNTDWWRARSRVLLLGGLGIALLAVLALAVAYARVDVLRPDEVDLPQATVLYYADGVTELSRQGVDRSSVELSEVPEHVRRAVLAAENRRFYSEPGISVRGIARAAWANLRGGEVTQGGSTITQQYARAQYLSQERTYRRKAREILVAVKLDRSFTKDEVLEGYLNTIYFGRQAYGIDAAARAYYGKPVADLTPEEGALLAGLIRAPSVLDPREEPEAAERRYRQVLTAMRDEGWYDGDPQAAPVPETPGRSGEPADVLYLEEQVRVELAQRDLDPEQDGLEVVTTIDKRAQDLARAGVAEELADVPEGVRTALVSVEPGTGAVRASYGGRTYDDQQALDAVWQERRQPGSSFKPVTLAAALSQGISLRSTYDGDDDLRVEGYPEGLSNFRDRSFGDVDLVEATAKSINTVYVPLGLDAGLDEVVSTAYALGVPESAELEAVPSLSLGTQFVRPVDMAAVFATFAAGGRHAEPYLVQKVTRDGRVLLEQEPEAEQVLDGDVAADVGHALQGVLGPGGTAAAAALDRPAAGKTGTTTDNTAAWFVGYTPQLSTAVALFGPKPADRLSIEGVAEVTGGSFPARLWQAYMSAAMEGLPVQELPPPAFVGDETAGASSRQPEPEPTGTTPSEQTPEQAPEPAEAPAPAPAPPPPPPPPPAPAPEGGPDKEPPGQKKKGKDG